MNRIITRISSMIVMTALLLLPTLAVGAPALAATPGTPGQAVCAGVGATGGTSDCTAPFGSPSVESIVRTALNVLSLIVGIAAVIMIILGGLRFVIASGDPQKIATARNSILYAVIGLAIAALAQVIVRFVLAKVK